jgi:glucose/arabinose dehydrogenase
LLRLRPHTPHPLRALYSRAGLCFTLAANGLLCYTPLGAQTTAPLLTHKAAMGDWTSDAPGVRRLIRVEDLPAPHASPSVDNGPHQVTRPAEAWPKAPSGFVVELLAQDLNNPRKVIAAPNGDLFVAESGPGRIKILRLGANGKLTQTAVFAEQLKQPFGIAFYPPGPNPSHVYIANTDSTIRFPYQNGDLKARGAAEMLVPNLPGGGRLRGGGHWTRDLVFRPDAKKMFISVGSRSNNGDDFREKNRADVLEYNPDGSGFRIFASGIRNSVGLAIEPQTGQLWGSVNERDGLGDDLPPDYITHFEEKGFYGWPWFYIGNHQDPRYPGKHPELAGKALLPDVLVQAHSASLCLAFCTAAQFPARYYGWAFAAEHGSWNRAHRTGYKVICVPIQNGKAAGDYEDFLTGFVTPAGDVWGRPVGVAFDAQGALIVTDDGGNCVWRVQPPAAKPEGAGK